MKATRIAEIEVELQTAIPNESYQPMRSYVVVCKVCSGATDDHKNNCYVPLVYELLDDAKQHAEWTTERGEAGE